MIHIEVNKTVIHGTLRNCDLVPVFLDLIQKTPEYQQIVQTNDWNLKVIFDPIATKNDERWKSEDMQLFIEDLFDILNNYAPEGCYFGAHVGDASDFGFWEFTED